jgi:hypothetical protein
VESGHRLYMNFSRDSNDRISRKAADRMVCVDAADVGGSIEGRKKDSLRKVE